MHAYIHVFARNVMLYNHNCHTIRQLVGKTHHPEYEGAAALQGKQEVKLFGDTASTVKL